MKVELLIFFNIARGGTLRFTSQSFDPIGFGQHGLYGSLRSPKSAYADFV